LYSTAAGNFSTAQGVGQFVVGQFNIPQGNPTVWSGTDDLFTVGNGSGYGNWSQNPTTYGPLFQAIATNPSNAFVVKKNGDTIVSGGLIVSGTTGYPTTIANSGLIVTGSAVTSGTITTIVATPSNLILIPQQGDLSMGTFVAGALPQSPAAQP
jgi:hypothetical protein